MAQARAARVDRVSFYGLSSRHGMRPTDHEWSLYYKDVSAGVRPVSLAVNQPIMGYMPKAKLMEVCNR